LGAPGVNSEGVPGVSTLQAGGMQEQKPLLQNPQQQQQPQLLGVPQQAGTQGQIPGQLPETKAQQQQMGSAGGGLKLVEDNGKGKGREEQKGGPGGSEGGAAKGPHPQPVERMAQLRPSKSLFGGSGGHFTLKSGTIKATLISSAGEAGARGARAADAPHGQQGRHPPAAAAHREHRVGPAQGVQPRECQRRSDREAGGCRRGGWRGCGG